MIRAVLDANVIASGVSGLRQATSTPGAVLRGWLNGMFELAVSDHLLDEVERTLSKPYFSLRAEMGLIETILSSLGRIATRVPVTWVEHGVATHPEDDLVLAAAVAAGADYLVTGDRQLQKLGSFRGVDILTPREFLAVLRAEHGENVGQSDEG